MPIDGKIVANHLRDCGQVHARALGRHVTLGHERLIIVVVRKRAESW